MTSSPTPQPSSKIAAVAPAPWTLRAEGYAFLLRQPSGRGVRCMMFVDYAASPVGPYRELLMIDRLVEIAGRRYPTISTIYVSSQASVDNGRRNWGIPKQLATFTVDEPRERALRLTMRVGDVPTVELCVQHGLLSLPIATLIVPPRLRTIGQRLDGNAFEVTPSGRGRVQRASLLHAWSDGARFPLLTQQSVLAVVRLSKVNLTFPIATVR